MENLYNAVKEYTFAEISKINEADSSTLSVEELLNRQGKMEVLSNILVILKNYWN